MQRYPELTSFKPTQRYNEITSNNENQHSVYTEIQRLALTLRKVPALNLAWPNYLHAMHAAPAVVTLW